MQSTASVKPPGGKLVRVNVTYDETIERVTITGDFFLEPPEARSALEEALEGHPRSVSQETLSAAVAAVDAQLIGFAADDLAAVTLEAIDS